MARATPTGTNNSTVSSPKKGRKSLSGQKLCFSPRTKVPNTNKVFVVGVSLGLILIGPQGTSIVRRSPRVSRIPYKSGQLFSHFFFKNFAPAGCCKYMSLC